MTGMLEEGLLDDYDSTPINLEDNATVNEPASFGSTNPAVSPDEKDPKTGNVNTDTYMHGSGAGAGPLPTGFGAPSVLNGGSTLTEFTKRRNWSQRVVEELKDFLHILTPDGRIIYVSPSSQLLTGFEEDELLEKFIVDFIHADDSGIFVREFNESIASGNPLRFFYRFRKKDGSYTIFESHGHPHLTSEYAQFGPSNAAGFCRGVFMMARPYPTKNSGLLDSFLEHKMENERLLKRINDLKREEEEDADESNRTYLSSKQGASEVPTESETIDTSTPSHALASGSGATMPLPTQQLLNSALTRQNLEDANASSKPDSIGDKMDRFAVDKTLRYEGATHIETIEMLTGLRYQDGERSRGISTGDMSPSLIRGDAGIAIPQDKERGDKKKKIKLPEEYVCTDCGK